MKKPLVKQKIKVNRTFDYPDCTVIWKFDSDKSTSGPYEVEIKQKTNRK